MQQGIFGYWIEKTMCGDNRPISKKVKSDRHQMPTRKEFLDAVGDV